MTPTDLAAARITQALAPRNIPLTAHRCYQRFAAQVAAESGLDVLDGIVTTIRRHSDLVRGAR